VGLEWQSAATEASETLLDMVRTLSQSRLNARFADEAADVGIPTQAADARSSMVEAASSMPFRALCTLIRKICGNTAQPLFPLSDHAEVGRRSGTTVAM